MAGSVMLPVQFVTSPEVAMMMKSLHAVAYSNRVVLDVTGCCVPREV